MRTLIAQLESLFSKIMILVHSDYHRWQNSTRIRYLPQVDLVVLCGAVYYCNNGTAILFWCCLQNYQQFFFMFQIVNGPVVLVSKVQVADAMKE
jgi:hypothetical protein